MSGAVSPLNRKRLLLLIGNVWIILHCLKEKYLILGEKTMEIFTRGEMFSA